MSDHPSRPEAALVPAVSVILSNRLPVSLSQMEGGGWNARRSSGGLVTALDPVLKAQPDTLWIGWPGCDLSPRVEEALARASAGCGYTLGPVDIPSADRNLFYLGFCNEVLWPLFHDLQSLCNYDPAYWRCYRRVNRTFAEAVAARAPHGGLVWIHDYHLMQVAGELAGTRPDLTCGFFLHIPFPPPDVFVKLPWREEILQGLLAHRLTGFQTPRDLANFTACCRAVLGTKEAQQEDGFVRLTWGGRDCLAGAFPIGIDTGDFMRRAAAPEVTRKAAALRTLLHDRQIILGVDRLDYTKGIPHRLRSFETMLERHPGLKGKVTFVQVVVPSREDIPAYARLKTEIEQMVARINGRFTDVGQWVPIHYVYRHMDQTDLLAWYRAAQVALVTPLKDGMNLVAKEYAVCSLEEDCTLILSEFAGAADELKEWAVLVNPNDREGVADALAQACRRPVEERRRAMSGMRRHLRRHTVFQFAGRFLQALGSAPGPADAQARSGLEGKVRSMAESPHRATLVLDYDGTLVPLRRRPKMAKPDADLLAFLLRLSDSFSVHIVSGRPRRMLQEWLGHLPLGLHGEHGLWSRMPGADWEANVDISGAWMGAAEAVLADACAGLSGTFVECKDRSVAWHYREARDERRAERAVRGLSRRLLAMPGMADIEAIHGHKVVEFRTKGIHKGLIIPRIVGAGHPVLVAGDDRTDEDLFRSLPDHAVQIKVGTGPTIAPYRLPTPAALRKLLTSVLPPAHP